jgi:class 3 adenylate cyclase/ActR/RegA family two-component response regulator
MVVSGDLNNAKRSDTSTTPLSHCNIRQGADEGKQLGKNLKKNEVNFSSKSENYCISFIDIVGSTQLTSKLYNSKMIEKFYTIFINEIADIVKNHNGKILKTVGDGIIFFFPETSEVGKIEGFRDAIECFKSMVSSRHLINTKLNKEKLPGISYRISADYGKMEVAMSGETANSYDLFGPTVNFCAKINKKTPPNGIAIGGDLRTIVNSFPNLANRYYFKEIKELTWKTNRYSYPVYILGQTEETTLRKNTILKTSKDHMLKIGTTSRPLTIMLVDDDPSISFLFTQYLKSAGMIVDSFIDPEKALTHFIKSNYRHYDLVITDIRMSHLNGFELYQQIKTIDPTVRIMFVSALDIAQEITTLLPDVKVNQFIIKPVNPSILINAVKQHAKRCSDGT